MVDNVALGVFVSIVGCEIQLRSFRSYQTVPWHVKTFTVIYVMMCGAHEIACTYLWRQLFFSIEYSDIWSIFL